MILRASLTDGQIADQSVLSFPGNFARNPGKNEATLVKTNPLNYAQTEAAQKVFGLMKQSMEKNGPVVTNIVSAAVVGGTDALAEDVGLHGRIFYNLALNPNEARPAAVLRYLRGENVQAIGPNDNIGENRDGSLQMLMYHSPGGEQEATIVAQMNEIAQRKPEVIFGTLSWNPSRTGMKKISFNETGVEEYRRYLSSLSDSGVVDIFSAGHDDHNTDEFGEVVSAAHLAIDEWMIRQGAVETLIPNENSDNLRRIAKARGIEPETDDESLYR